MVMPCPMQAHGPLSVQQDHRCSWRVQPYDGGPYRHTFRTCSYCGGMHPEDLIRLIEQGADVSGTTKGHKFYVERVPNPIAGQRCRSGSRSGPVFDRGHGQRLANRLRDPSIMPRELGRATIMERLRGHYERPTYSPAPQHCFAKFYTYHIESEEQQERLNRAIRTQRARRLTHVPGD